MSNVPYSLPVSAAAVGTTAGASSASLRFSSSATLASPAVDVLHHRIVEVCPLNPRQRPGGLPLFRVGRGVGVRRAYRLAQFLETHARSTTRIVASHVPGDFLVLVVRFVIPIAGRFVRSGGFRRKNSIIFNRLREVSGFVRLWPLAGGVWLCPALGRFVHTCSGFRLSGYIRLSLHFQGAFHCLRCFPSCYPHIDTSPTGQGSTQPIR